MTVGPRALSKPRWRKYTRMKKSVATSVENHLYIAIRIETGVKLERYNIGIQPVRSGLCNPSATPYSSMRIQKNPRRRHSVKGTACYRSVSRTGNTGNTAQGADGRYTPRWCAPTAAPNCPKAVEMGSRRRWPVAEEEGGRSSAPSASAHASSAAPAGAQACSSLADAAGACEPSSATAGGGGRMEDGGWRCGAHRS